jgi:uncharacterized membrane protein
MSDLIVIAYPEESRAAAAMATLQRLEEQYLVDLQDAVAVIKGSDGGLDLDQSVSLTRMGAATGTLSGSITGAVGGVLIGMLGPMSLFGAALVPASVPFCATSPITVLRTDL